MGKMWRLQEGWATVALLAIMLTTAASAVAAARWTEEGLNLAWLAGLGGLLAGLVLSKSRFSEGTVFIFATLYGLFWVGFLICYNLLEGDMHRRSWELVVRLNNFLYYALRTDRPSRDWLPFPVAVDLMFWYFGLLCAWAAFRQRAVWPAVLPPGMGLIVNNFNYNGPVDLDWYLALYVLCSLLFVARVSLLIREEEWRATRVRFSPELRLGFLRAGLVVALAGVLVGWAMPSVAASPEAAATWRQVTDGPLSFMRETWIRLFSAVRGYGQANTDFFGDSLTLAGPSRLTDEPIMDAKVEVVAENSGALSAVQRYYWRAAAYSVYADGRWQVGELGYRSYTAGQTQFDLNNYLLRREVKISIVPHAAASSRLYAPGQLRWTDVSSLWETPVEADGVVEAIGYKAQLVLARGTPYSLVAAMSIADETSLRAAGVSYPAWVRTNYLNLPPEVTQRTRALARQIVTEAGATNPYDQAQAITAWLRANMTYNQEIDPAPVDRDPVDYFLFNSREGYCNYYASAMVVMLRSLGIPARLTVGFNEGQLDPATRTYRVLQENAHAWPEVYFPRYGWIEFEPTVSEEPLRRPVGQPDAANTDPDSGNNPDRGNDRDSNLPPEELEDPTEDLADPLADPNVTPPVNPGLLGLQMALGAVGLAAAGGLGLISLFKANVIGWESFGSLGAWVLAWQGQWFKGVMAWLKSGGRAPAAVIGTPQEVLLTATGQAPATPGARLKPFPSPVHLVYMHLERVTVWLGLKHNAALTPHERATAIVNIFPRAETSVAAITTEYVTERYSPRYGDGEAARDHWHTIRYRLWHDALVNYLLRHLEEDELLEEARAKAQQLKRE